MSQTQAVAVRETDAPARNPLPEVQLPEVGRLTIIADAGKDRHGRLMDCLCACGNATRAYLYDLRTGRVISCGCFQRDRMAARHGNRTHGGKGTAEYRTWTSMKNRCHNRNADDWDRYGGRGVAVCECWRESFQSFLEDMGPRPSPAHSIDRIDGTRGYEPDNCRWATQTEQQRNRSSNHLVTYRGETLPIIVWAERYGLHKATLRSRLASGWTVETALTTPINPAFRRCAA